jgi:hypothetical protein
MFSMRNKDDCRKRCEEIDFFSFERKRYQSFCKIKTLVLLLQIPLVFIEQENLGEQANKELLEPPIQIQICALKKLGDKAYGECSRHCPERSLSSSLNLGPKQHVLQDVISCTLDVETCWSRADVILMSYDDVICFYHKEQLLKSFFGGFAYPERSLCTSQT